MADIRGILGAMRTSRTATALAMSLLLALAGCTSVVNGTATRDPATAPLTLAKDDFGIVAGFDDAPVRIEIYTEPQCSHCADLQADFGSQLAYYIGIGALSVTYRPLTFLDTGAVDYSERVANAMFVAAGQGPGGDHPEKATGTQFQKFVEQLWAHPGSTGTGPTDDEIARLARDSGVPPATADAIAKAESAVDVKQMEDVNFEFLYEIDSGNAGTPTIYDLNRDEKIDVYDNDWLSKLMQR